MSRDNKKEGMKRAQWKYRLAWAWLCKNKPEVANQLKEIAARKYPYGPPKGGGTARNEIEKMA